MRLATEQRRSQQTQKEQCGIAHLLEGLNRGQFLESLCFGRDSAVGLQIDPIVLVLSPPQVRVQMLLPDRAGQRLDRGAGVLLLTG